MGWDAAMGAVNVVAEPFDTSIQATVRAVEHSDSLCQSVRRCSVRLREPQTRRFTTQPFSESRSDGVAARK
jgi:hypothetical protein